MFISVIFFPFFVSEVCLNSLLTQLLRAPNYSNFLKNPPARGCAPRHRNSLARCSVLYARLAHREPTKPTADSFNTKCRGGQEPQPRTLAQILCLFLSVRFYVRFCLFLSVLQIYCGNGQKRGCNIPNNSRSIDVGDVASTLQMHHKLLKYDLALLELFVKISKYFLYFLFFCFFKKPLAT